MGMFDFLGDLGSSIESDPAKFAILADTIGSRLAPKNPFAGAGMAIGQSAKANKAYQKQQTDNNDFRNNLIKALGGMTPDGTKGVTSYKVTPGKEPGMPNQHQVTFNTETQGDQTGHALNVPTGLPTQATPSGPQYASPAVNNLMGIYPF